MGILTELAKRAALKTATRAAEIPTQAERVVGQIVPHTASPLAQVSRTIESSPITPMVKEGLESPQRRKFLKQVASTAIQSQMPGSITSQVMKGITPSMQEGMARAAAESNLTPLVPAISKKLTDFLLSGNLGDELNEIGSVATYPALTRHVLTHFYPPNQLSALESAIKKLDDFDVQIRETGLFNGDQIYGDLPEWMHFGELSNALESGVIPKSMTNATKRGWPVLKSHSLTPEELDAVKAFEKISPHYSEGMDDIAKQQLMPTEAPTTSLKDFQDWIIQHENYLDQLDYGD